MKKTKKSLALFLAILIVTIMPNYQVYSAVGCFSENTSALIANKTQILEVCDTKPKTVSLAAAASFVAGALLLGVAAFGAIDGWNSIHPKELAVVSKSKDYNKMDFTVFDN